MMSNTVWWFFLERGDYCEFCGLTFTVYLQKCKNLFLKVFTPNPYSLLVGAVPSSRIIMLLGNGNSGYCARDTVIVKLGLKDCSEANTPYHLLPSPQPWPQRS